MNPHQFLKACFGFTLISFTAFAAPLDNWHWRNPVPNSNPQPAPNTMNGIVFANGKFVAVGDNGAASISTDTINWTESATATTNRLNQIAYVNGLFMAVGEGGALETSADGTNWMLRNSGITNSLSAVAYGNGKYVATANGAVLISSNSADWLVSGSNSFSGVTFGSAGFMAVNSSSNIFLSTDGITWTNLTLYNGPFYTNGAGAVVGIAHGLVTYANGTYFVTGARRIPGYQVRTYIFTSTDAVNWTTNTVADLGAILGFSYRFFIVGNGVPMAFGLSPSVYHCVQTFNGVSWANNLAHGLLGETNSQGSPSAGAFGNGTNVVVGSGSPLAQVCTSIDGVTWTNRLHLPDPPTGPANNLFGVTANNGAYVIAAANSVVWSSNGLSYAVASNTPAFSAVAATGAGFVGVGSGGTIFLSGDGLSWTQRNSGTLNNLHGLTVSGGLLVAVGDNGTIQTSPTGSIWTSRTSGTSLALSGITCGNGQFVTVGQMGTVLTSPNGIDWTGQDSGLLTNLVSVTYGSAGFLAAGPGGVILTSPDGVNWTRQNSGTSATLESATYGNGYYLVTGDNAVVLTSPDGTNWISRNIGATGAQNILGSAFLNNRFQIVGTGGTVLESDAIAPLYNFQFSRAAGAGIFSIFPTPGSTYRIQTCTNLDNPSWTDAAVFTNAAAVMHWTNSLGSGQQFFRIASP